MAANLEYISPFRTKDFSYTADSTLDIEIQPFYDGSVNIISTAEDTPPRIVNSRQKFSEADVELIVRNDGNLDNVYGSDSIEKTLLVPIIGDIVPNLVFNEVTETGGQLLNGGYIYYFKLKTADGVESAIIEESRLVSVHSGTKFGKAETYIDNTITKSTVRFTISNLDTKVYQYISVYYVRATGSVEPTVKTAFHIDHDYEIKETGVDTGLWECSIVHTGFEKESGINVSEVIADYSPIDSAITVTQKNNRLLLGNIKSISITDDILKTAALSCYVEDNLESPMFIEQPMYKGNTTNEDTYANPYNIYYKTAYHPGETYEFAINYVFRNGFVSNAYPIMGFDWENHGSTTFDTSKLGTDVDWIGNNGGPTVQNSHGVVRMKNKKIEDTMRERTPANKNMAMMDVYTMAINTTKMVVDQADALYALGIRSYFISRKKRIPDMLMEGLLTQAATAPVSTGQEQSSNIHTMGMYCGYGSNGSISNNMVIHPLPGNAMPYSTEIICVGGIASAWQGSIIYGTGQRGSYFDGVLYAPLANVANSSYFALFSPDITSDTAKAATLNTKSTYSLYTTSLLRQSIDYVDQEILRNIPAKYAMTANPYRLTTTGNIATSEIIEIQYVDDSLRAFSSLSFAGKLDRQGSLFLNRPIASETDNSTDVYYIGYDDQLAFSTTQLVTNPTKNLYYREDQTLVGSNLMKFDTDTTFQILMPGVNYSPYIGIKLDPSNAVSGILSTTLDISSTPDVKGSYFTGFGGDNMTTNQTGNTDFMVPADDLETSMGAMVRVYANNQSSMLDAVSWVNKYKISKAGSFSAISERYPIHQVLNISTSPWSVPFLKGGDCYAGFYYQRVWRPGGIAGVPTATNPSLYTYDDGGIAIREGVNITNSGYAIGFPVRSVYNFAIRASYSTDDVEKKLYGKDRSYTSSFPEGEVHGNRQAESAKINYGNILHESVLTTEPFDPTIPYLKLDYDNRVITSEISVTGEFENGFRNFKGLNYKDYDESLGPITVIVSNGLYTYIVYKNGISLVEISERSAITSESTQTNVYIASADVLPPKSTPIFTSTGSQHLRSIVPTETGIYGIDAEAKKVWAIKVTEKKVISDMTIQTLLNELITSTLNDIIGSYDVTTEEITFTFIYNDNTQKSILYNAEHNTWCGTTDIHRLYQFNIENKALSLQRPDGTSIYNLYYPVLNTTENVLFKEVGQTTAIDDRTALTKTVYDSYIEFIVKSEELFKFDLSNIIINGIGVPSSIDIVTDNQENYTIDTAHVNVSGIVQQTLPVHTNVYMQDSLSGDLNYLDTYRFERTRNTNYKTLKIGDKITLDLNNTLQQFVIANVSFDENVTDTVVLSEPMINSTLNALYYGWKVPVRISLGESLGGKVKLTIPSKKHADLLKMDVSTAQNYHVNYSNAKPYGRWVKLRLNFKGIDQIYIESVMSEITLRYS